MGFQIENGILVRYIPEYFSERVIVPDGVTAVAKGVFCRMPCRKVILPHGLTHIGDEAFDGCKLTAVVLPDTLKIIGKRAFADTGQLSEIVLPDSLLAVGREAFCNSALRRITFPAGLKRLGKDIFKNCFHLEDVCIPADFSLLDACDLPGYGGKATRCGDRINIDCRCMPESERYDANGLQIFGSVLAGLSEHYPGAHLDVPAGITRIGRSAFSRTLHTGLQSISLPDTLTEISDNAAVSCKLTHLHIPEGVTRIGNDAFANNTALADIRLPESLRYIGNGAFQNCAVQTLRIPAQAAFAPERTFHTCGDLRCITLPDTVTAIGTEMFYRCKSLKQITLPETLTVIQKRGFFGCSSLNEIILPDSVTRIEAQAFQKCESLTRIRLPENVRFFGENIFEGCTDLKNFALPPGTHQIPPAMFSGCHSITGMALPETVHCIERNAFFFCTSLKTIDLSRVCIIRKNAFAYCTALESVTLPPAPLLIEEDVFKNCEALREIRIFPDTPPVYCDYGDISNLTKHLPAVLKMVSAGDYDHSGSAVPEKLLSPFVLMRYLHDRDGKAETYLRLHCEELTRRCITAGDHENVRLLLGMNPNLTPRHLDIYIRLALDAGQQQVWAVLANHKNSRFGFTDNDFTDNELL